jgi:UPF0755 protein
VKRELLWSLVAIAALLLWAAVAVGLFVAAPILRGDVAGAPPVRIDVTSGSTLKSVAAELHDKGVIRHQTVFERYAVVAGFDRQIRAGEYEFVAGEPYRDILTRLRRGDILQVRVTVPEGRTNLEISKIYKRRMGIDPDEFLALTFDESLITRWNIEAPSLEGYLFPDTYTFPTKYTARQVIETMLGRFFTVWTPEHEERARALGMTRGEILTLASIVEGEALLDSETRRISAVYHNRLERRMRLQADPTVAYALGGVRRRLYYKDLRVDSPYNTYRNTGLPPGPVCNPGRVAIEAALHPIEGTGELYFVAASDGTGRHIFTRTLRDHINAKNRAKRRR